MSRVFPIATYIANPRAPASRRILVELHEGRFYGCSEYRIRFEGAETYWKTKPPLAAVEDAEHEIRKYYPAAERL